MFKVFSAIGKWSGRATALLLFLFWGAFFVEHLTEWFLRGDGRYPPAWVWGQQFFHFVMLVGLGMMLRWEKAGAVVMAIGTVAFFSCVGFRGFPGIALINLVPIGCFGIHWLTEGMLRASGVEARGFSTPQKLMIAALGLAFTAFVLLCVNEMFGNPPLLTPALPLSSILAGSWQARAEAWPGPTEIDIRFIVNDHGTISGRIGDAVIAGARITGNRTWFGRAVDWRTDYIIRGELSGTVGVQPLRNGNGFTAPLNLEGLDLVGSIFTSDNDTGGKRVTSNPLVSRLRLKKM